MTKTAIIKARIDVDLKKEIEIIFHELGLNASVAINLFYQQVRLRHGLPFNVNIPQEVTIQTFKDTDKNHNIIECENADDMFKKLGI